MAIYDIMLQNAFLYVLIQGIIIVASSTIAYVNTRQLYNLSQHPGIKYFSNAFFYFAVGFTANTLTGMFIVSGIPTGPIISAALILVFFYSLLMSAFYLIFSLVWKKLEQKILAKIPTIKSSKRRFAYLVAGMHILAAILTLLAFFSEKNYILFVPILIVLGFAVKISYTNYKSAKKPKPKQIRQLFFIGIVFAFIGFLVNFLGVEFLNSLWPEFIIYQNMVTVLVFLLLVFGVMRSVNKW